MNIDLDPVPFYKVIENTDMIPKFPGKNGMIKNMQRAIKIARPRLLRSKVLQKHIEKNTSIGELFDMFLNLFEDMCGKDSGYTFEVDDNGFYIDMHYYYPCFSYNFYVMPLDFLPDLAKKNMKLHNIMVDSIRYLIDKKGILAMSDMGYYDLEEWIQESMIYEDEDDVDVIAKKDNALVFYRKYFEKYNALINKPYKNISALHDRIKKYTPLYSIESRTLDWCVNTIRVAETPGNMQDLVETSIEQHCRIEEIDKEDYSADGQPLSPEQWIAFGWLDDETFNENFGQYLGDIAGNFGSLEYHEEYKCRTQKDLLQSRKKFNNGQEFWLIGLLEVFEAGIDLVDDLKKYINGQLIILLDYDEPVRQVFIPA